MKFQKIPRSNNPAPWFCLLGTNFRLQSFASSWRPQSQTNLSCFHLSMNIPSSSNGKYDCTPFAFQLGQLGRVASALPRSHWPTGRRVHSSAAPGARAWGPRSSRAQCATRPRSPSRRGRRPATSPRRWRCSRNWSVKKTAMIYVLLHDMTVFLCVLGVRSSCWFTHLAKGAAVVVRFFCGYSCDWNHHKLGCKPATVAL